MMDSVLSVSSVAGILQWPSKLGIPDRSDCVIVVVHQLTIPCLLRVQMDMPEQLAIVALTFAG